MTIDPYTAPDPQHDPEPVDTLDTIAAKRRELAKAPQPLESDASATVAKPGSEEGETSPGSVEELEEEAGQEGAYNPETGEINWDCPCLGGMADGPCGEEFKAAFSCFVYSTEEPKGINCIDNFKWVSF